MKPIPFLLAASLFALGQTAFAKTVTVKAGPDAQERLQSALIDAKPGDTVLLGKGKFVLTDGLSLDVAKVTVRGAGPNASILSFKGQKGAGEGLLVTSDDVVLRGFAVEDSRGDGIKSKGVKRITFYDLRVEWTGGPKVTNGAYGVYPVSSTDVLIDKVVVKGASDAGIYVGQSQNIIVRNSYATQNVAGIEIENSFNADVYGNLATRNTGGILVFDLPNLPQKGGHSIRIFNNRVMRNDVANFAAPGSTVSGVPVGTGVMVMANRNVHIFENELSDNATANVFVVAYKYPFTDADYDPMVRDVVVRNNKHGRGGWAPGFKGGKELTAALGGVTAPAFWDGVGGAEAHIHMSDPIKVLTLGLAKPDTPVTDGKPGIIDLSKVPAATMPAAIVLPASMEAATR
jgi:parallel beta-helix repeat protein